MKLTIGIGVGVGVLVGGVITALKGFKIWPFNRKAKRPGKRPTSTGEEAETSSKAKRGHARAWTVEDTY